MGCRHFGLVEPARSAAVAKTPIAQRVAVILILRDATAACYDLNVQEPTAISGHTAG